MPLHFIGTTPRHGFVEPGRYDAVLQDMGRTLPGRKRWSKEGRLEFEPSPANWLAVAVSLQAERWSDDARKAVLTARQGEVERDELAQRHRAPTLSDEDFDFRHRPFDHQMTAWGLSRDLKAFALLMGMGTGKTKVTIDSASWLFKKGEIDTALVIAPNGVHTQWVDQQLPTHTPASVPYRGLATSTKSMTGTKREVAEFNSLLDWKDGLRVFSLNCESLSHDSGIRVAHKILTSGKTLLVIDESRRFGNPGADRTKAMFKLAKLAPYRRILTGTPITQGLQDLYAQFKILDPNILGYSTFTAFRARYCTMGGFEGRQIIGYQNEKELQEKIAPYSYRVTKEDCLDLPPKVYEVREFVMTDEQKKRYKQMKEEAIASIGDTTLDVTVGAAVITKLHQIACGFLMGEERDIVWRAEPNPRITALLDTFEEAGDQPAIVWCRFREDIQACVRALKKAGKRPVAYWGGLTPEERKRTVEDFMSGKADVFVGQVDAGGTGLNLQRATLVIYYSNSFSAESRWQSEDRAHRIGQQSRVLYVDLVARGTVDKRIRQLLMAKESVAVRTLDGIKAVLGED